MATEDYGIAIKCDAQGCFVDINAMGGYAWWRTLQDLFSQSAQYPERSDAQDLAEAEMLRYFKSLLKGVADGDMTLEEYETNIRESGYPYSNASITSAVEAAAATQHQGFLNRFEETFNKDPKELGELFYKYENAGYPDNPYIDSFSLFNPEQVLDRMILGDSDIGAKVDICSSTVTTNCVDPKSINDLWDDFGRHVQIIFKGLEIPGLPKWLPWPSIMSLPTLGEIWDAVSGPFKDAARDQLRECMAGPDGKTGTSDDKPASVCLEERDIAGIITKGIQDGAKEVATATEEKVTEAVNKILEAKDCVTNPAECAGEIKDYIEGVFGSADPTQPGLPPWMRAIILGGQYGEEIIGALEDLFNVDIDDNGTVGLPIAGADYDCSQVGRDQVVGAKSADQCGKCVETTADGVPFEVNLTTGRCEDPTVFEPELTAEEQECKDSGRIYDETTGTCTDKCINKDYEVDPVSGDCGPPVVEECTDPNRLKNPDGSCSDKCKSGEIDPQTGRCPEPDDDDDDDDEGEGTGVYQGVDSEMDTFCRQGLAALEGTFAAKSWRFNCSDDYCLSGAPKTEVDGVYGANCAEYTPPYTPVVECTDPKRYKNPDGSCSDRCTDGTPAPTDGSLCGEVNSIDQMCSKPRPEEYGYAQINWDKYCADDDAGVDDGGDNGGDDENYGFIVDCEQPKISYTPSFNYDKNLAYNSYSREYDSICLAGTGPDDGADDPDCSTITEANYAACGKVKCPDGSFKDNYDACFAGTDGGPDDGVDDPDCSTITDANYVACGKVKCPDGSFKDTDSDCSAVTSSPCDQQNRVTNEDGSCGECKPGWIEDPEGFDQCIQAPPECNDCSCPGYAVANPRECAQCPEGQEYCEATGACATPEECAAASAPPPEPDSGGMLGGGAAGAFTPFLAGLDYEAQPLPTVEAPPQKDYMAELDSLIKRNLFEGLV